MFTGIIEKTGKVISITAPAETAGGLMTSITQLIIDAGKNFETRPGDSVAINGCCLTVTSNKVSMLAFDVSRETLQKTNLRFLQEGTDVNLERAMKLGDRLGGHLVSGHVDDMGMVQRVRKQADGWEVFVSLPRALGRYIIPKGSICLDGVSLTVNQYSDEGDNTVISVMLIPTTVSLTSFQTLTEKQLLNVEVDLIGKYLERLAMPRL